MNQNHQHHHLFGKENTQRNTPTAKQLQLSITNRIPLWLHRDQNSSSSSSSDSSSDSFASPPTPRLKEFPSASVMDVAPSQHVHSDKLAATLSCWNYYE